MPNFTQQPKPPRPGRISLFLKIALCTAICLHILVLLLFRISSNTLPDRGPSNPYITFVSEKSFAKNVELEEYSILFDSAPLFIPTQWNASQSVKVDFENVSMGPFAEFEPTIELLEKLQPDGLLIADDYSVNEPSDLLASCFWRFFENFGWSTSVVSAFETTTPIAEISVMGNSQTPAVLLEVDLESATSFSITSPVSYAIRRSNQGLIWGMPTLMETSGNDVFDRSVAKWLQRPDVLAQLPVGYLSIRVFFW